MALAFEEAQKVVKETKSKIRYIHSNDIIGALSENGLKQGQFYMNAYFEEGGANQPELLGMRISINFSDNLRKKMNDFAEKRGLEVDYHSGGCCSGPYSKLYEVKRGVWHDSRKRVAYFSDSYFLASTPELFEEIGTELLGLKI
ncbi:hypothetical protein EPN87_02090 [archaeon]|nr:MAG: hypothetical protein EPN87_02090 [archaeon]